MKKLLLLSVYVILGINLLISQNIQWSWTFVSEGSGKDRCTRTALDSAYNVYTAGYFSDTLIFEDDTLIASDAKDYFVLKLDSNGNYLWSLQIEGSGSIRDIDAAPNGELLITGNYSGSVDLSGNTLSGGSAFIVKYDAGGNYIWSKNISGTNILLTAVDVNVYGDVYLSGNFDVSINTDTINHVPGTATYEVNLFLIKYNSGGSALWIRSALIDNMSNFFGAVDMVSDLHGNAYVLSIITCNSDFGNGVTYTHTSATEGNILVKYNPQGDAQWCRASSSAYGLSQTLDLSYDNTSGLYYTGHAMGDMEIGGTTFPIDFALSNEIFYIKYDTSGNYLWAHSLGSVGSANDLGVNIEFDTSGTGFLMGLFGDTLIVPSVDTLTGPDTSSVLMASNLFYAKMNSSGTITEARKADLIIDDFMFGEIDVSDEGVLYLAGYDISSSSKGFKSSSSNSFIGKAGQHTPVPIAITSLTTPINCYGECTGSIIVDITGGTSPYSLLWDNAAMNDTITNLCAGMYCLTVTDDQGDTSSICINITEPTELMLSVSSTNDSGSGDGTATVTPSGATPPYTYLWTTTSTDSIITNLSIGSYIVTVTDANGCYVIDTAVVDLANYNEDIYGINTDFNIYPNPSNGLFNIKSNTNIDNLFLIIYDTNGKLILSNKYTINQGENKEIDLSMFNKGIYIAKFITEGKVIIEKLIVDF